MENRVRCDLLKLGTNCTYMNNLIASHERLNKIIISIHTHPSAPTVPYCGV